MHSFVTSKNVKWCHLIWPTLYIYLQSSGWCISPWNSLPHGVDFPLVQFKKSSVFVGLSTFHSFIHSFIPFYFRPLAHKQKKHTKDTKTNTLTDTNQTNELWQLLTNLLHEVDQLISKAYLQLLMMVLKLGMPVSINTLVKMSYRL